MRAFAAALACMCLITAPSASDSATKGTPSDDAAQIILSVENSGSSYAWELPYAQARELVVKYISEGKPDLALQAAKMQFIICPPPFDPGSTESAIRSVEEALIALDGNDKRAKRFRAYAPNGPAGPDGRKGTADDIANPIEKVSLDIFKKDDAFYGDFDSAIDRRASVASEKDRAWYETEKAYARLSGGEFDRAAILLMSVLKSQAWVPHSHAGDREKIRVQDTIDRAVAGLSVVYRGRTGTVAGMDGFCKRCLDYATYGPAGQDGREGTADDLQSPI